MAFFQSSVLKSHLALLEETIVDKAYKKYQKYFWNTTIQENRARRKNKEPEIDKPSKKDKFEWMEHFEENKNKAQELQAQIAISEKEIDQMVYKLYGLSEEETVIIENS